MSLSPAVLDAMLEAGCTAEQIVAAVKADAAADDARREAKRAHNAERQRRFKARRRGENGDEVGDNAGNALPSVIALDKKAPHTPKKINPKSPPISPPFADEIVEFWNEQADRSGLTKARGLSRDRKAKLRKRLTEFSQDDLRTAIRNLAGSKFHCGENDRGWIANLGWLLKSEETVQNALEMGGTGPPSKSNDYLDHFLSRTAKEPAE